VNQSISRGMSYVDTVDEFKFKADGTNSYSFKVRPSSDQGQMSLQAVDGDGVQLGQSTAPNRGVAKLQGLKLAKPGYIYVSRSPTTITRQKGRTRWCWESAK
jgi:hypothetical protein